MAAQGPFSIRTDVCGHAVCGCLTSFLPTPSIRLERPSGVIPNVKVQSLTRRQADKAPTPTSNVLSVDLHSTGISRKARKETMTSAAKGLNVADLLEAPGLTSSLRDRLQAADANGDGVISASEMIDVIQSEITATRDRKMMQRVLIALGVACLLIIAAVVGLTYAVVEMSKDTSVQNNVLVGKDGLQPLSTATLRKRAQLADLYKAESPYGLDLLTHVTVPFGKGEAVLKIQNVYLVPGRARALGHGCQERVGGGDGRRGDRVWGRAGGRRQEAADAIKRWLC